jgi:DNA repair protein RadD
VIDELGPIDALDIRKTGYKEKEEGVGEAIIKRCPACGAECAAAQRYCYSCSYNFVNEGLVQIPETKSILQEEIIEEHDVIGMKLKYHRKSPDKPATMQVSYATMSGEFKEWVCFDHTGFAREKAVKWHMLRSEQTPPANVNEALERQYPTPSRIKVKKDGKYWRVLSSFFDKKHDNITEEQIRLAEMEDIPF